MITTCSQPSPELARLQFISMIPSVNATIIISPTNDSSSGKSHKLNYAATTGYMKFEPGQYLITYSADGEKILNHTFALGKKSYQTLVIAGMMPDSTRINPQTFWFSIKNVLAGSEATSINAYLPQFLMLRDRWRGSKTKGTIRFINTSPLADNLRIKDRSGNLDQQIVYPRNTEPASVKAGTHSLKFFLGDVVLAQKSITAEKGYTHTVIMGNAVSSDSSLKITSYKTASKALQ